MAEQDRPKLTLGQPPGRLRRETASAPRAWLVVLILQLATLAIVASLLIGRDDGRAPNPGRSSPALDDLRDVAMELENKSLDGPAARAWESYLDVAPEPADRAEILYRIGRLYMQADQYDEAAAALVRSELAAGNNEELKSKIGPQIVTCLRRLGQYGEVGRELSRRVEVGAQATAKGRVLAKLAGDPLTEADLDRLIQRRVDQMLSVQGGTGDETLRQAMLEQFARPDARQQLFQELLQTELLARRARELNLDQDPDFLPARRFLEDGLLASRVQAREMEKINPTDVDLEAFYHANSDRYRQPESLQAVLIQLEDNEDAGALLASIKSAHDFRQLAAARRPESSGDNASPVAHRLVRGRRHPQLGDVDQLFSLESGAWTEKPHAGTAGQYLVLVESKSSAHTAPLAEVREQVRSDYIARKQHEVSRQLFQNLMTRYQVQLMPLVDDSGQDQDSTRDSSNEPNEGRTP